MRTLKSAVALGSAFALATVGCAASSQPDRVRAAEPGSAAADAATAQTVADFLVHSRVRGTETAASYVGTTVADLRAVEPEQAEALEANSKPTDHVVVVQISGNFVANHSRPANGTAGAVTVLVQAIYDIDSDQTLGVQYFDFVPGQRGAAANAADAASRAAAHVALSRLSTPLPLQLTSSAS